MELIIKQNIDFVIKFFLISIVSKKHNGITFGNIFGNKNYTKSLKNSRETK